MAGGRGLKRVAADLVSSFLGKRLIPAVKGFDSNAEVLSCLGAKGFKGTVDAWPNRLGTLENIGFYKEFGPELPKSWEAVVGFGPKREAEPALALKIFALLFSVLIAYFFYYVFISSFFVSCFCSYFTSFFDYGFGSCFGYCFCFSGSFFSPIFLH
jgi:hypothetical protein